MEMSCINCGSSKHNDMDCVNAKKYCGFCKTVGHRKAQCPERPRCSACGAIGHNKSTCSYAD